jgi:hypothetical protein
MRGSSHVLPGSPIDWLRHLVADGRDPWDHQAPRGIRAETAESPAQRARCGAFQGLRWGREAGRSGPFLGKTAMPRGFDPGKLEGVRECS